MVAKQIMRELSEIVQRDQVVTHAVLPESALGADLYLSSVTTITDVEVTADLQVHSFKLFQTHTLNNILVDRNYEVLVHKLVQLSCYCGLV
jgi:hypothetical protein